jgi:endonuclease YncB( thermonuclease family)
MQEVLDSADGARQSAPGTAIIAPMPRAIAILGLAATTLVSASAGAADGYDSGRVAWVTDGDTFRLESGERIRIAGIDDPETHRDQARCSGEIVLGLQARDRATSLLAGRDVTFHRLGRSYNWSVATVIVDGHDLGTELVRLGAAAWWPRGRPKPVWCRSKPRIRI